MPFPFLITIHHSIQSQIEWDQMVAPMQGYQQIKPSNRQTREELRVLMAPSEELIAAQENLSRARKILDADYHKADLRDVVSKQASLDSNEK